MISRAIDPEPPCRAAPPRGFGPLRRSAVPKSKGPPRSRNASRPACSAGRRAIGSTAVPPHRACLGSPVGFPTCPWPARRTGFLLLAAWSAWPAIRGRDSPPAPDRPAIPAGSPSRSSRSPFQCPGRPTSRAPPLGPVDRVVWPVRSPLCSARPGRGSADLCPLPGSSPQKAASAWSGIAAAEHRAAVGQVAQVVLEGGKACDRLAIDLEAGQGVGDALLGIGDHREDVAAELAERRALRFVQTLQVVVDLDGRHQVPPGSSLAKYGLR